MNVIFLDMDGVLNSQDFIDKWTSAHGDSIESIEEFKRLYYVHDGQEGYVVPELLERLWNICYITDCRIVWSSSWRERFYTVHPDSGESRFDWHGISKLWRAKWLPLGRLVGCTPCLDRSRFSYVPRGCEIQRWIDDNAERLEVGKMAVLDDDEDAEIGLENPNVMFFHTTFQHGMTEDVANRVIAWFDASTV